MTDTNALPPSGGFAGAPYRRTAHEHIYVQTSNAVLTFPIQASGDAVPQLTLSFETGCAVRFPNGVAVDSSGRVYITDGLYHPPGAPGGSAVEVYSVDFSTNRATQIGAIAGSDTHLNVEIGSPGDLALDRAGNVYVANYGSITEYAAGASGNAAPIREISGSNTGVTPAAGGQTPRAIVVGSDGTLYVSTFAHNSILEFAPGSSGNVAPSGVIQGPDTKLREPSALAIDDAGNIYASNNYFLTGVTEYPPRSRGDVAPIRQIAGAASRVGDYSYGIALDAKGRIYVSAEYTYAFSGVPAVLTFARNANGDVPPINVIQGNVLQSYAGQLAIH